ncbi:AMP-binding protein [Pseudonocardia sp. TRM90224]|uniref:AMP-binding protein n=1 Tax=Pseudonocardia sp. TRM90224 TaxID=2812678 RepID=UPI001E2F47D5|nr:AMP-binding protein [Pseudonocardia sp. TRM90224]
MAFVDQLDKGASLGRDAPCLVTDDEVLTYGEVQDLSWDVARALARSGIQPGETVAVLSENDPVASACIFGISRRGAVWCPISPHSDAEEVRRLLDHVDCAGLIFQSAFAPLLSRIASQLPALRVLVCLDAEAPALPSLESWLEAGTDAEETADPDPAPSDPVDAPNPDDIAIIAGTSGTTGTPKSVVITGRAIEAMVAAVLGGYPFDGRPTFLTMCTPTHVAAGLCLPIMTLGGRIVIMRKPDVGRFVDLVVEQRVTHTLLSSTLLGAVLRHPGLANADLSSLQCFWYGAAPMPARRLEAAITTIGPVMAQLYGQAEAPLVIATMAPRDHFDREGTIARHRLTSVGRPSPLVTVGIMDEDGTPLGVGERGEIVVRGSLVMAGYHKDPAATVASRRHGWHRTGDIGYLDDDGFLYLVDRAKDVIVSGGSNIYSAEVEQALMQHPSVLDCAVVGLPDEKWGERIVVVVQLAEAPVDDTEAAIADLLTFADDQLGGVEAPMQVEVWPELPRSTTGKVLKREVRQVLMAGVSPK